MSGILAALVGAAARGGALVAVALFVNLAMRRSSAAARHAVLVLGILGHLLVPLVPPSVPRLRVPYPAPDETVVEQTLTAAASGSAPVQPPGAEWSLAGRPDPENRRPAPVDPIRALGIAWLAVALLIVVRYAAGLLGVARYRASGRAARDELPDGAIPSAARAAGLRRLPDVRFADVPMPVACGFLHPAVLLPPPAVAWSASRLHMVLVHEMAHVRRRDVAVQGLAQLACALFWFDPLIWWARAQLRADAESAADDAVLRAGMPADRYVLELVSLLRESLHVPAPLAAASIGRGLDARARRALDARPRRDTLRRRPLVVGLLLTLAVTFLLGAATPIATSPGGTSVIESLATGCIWRAGSRHIDRWTEEAGRPRWQVLWEGDDCEVELLATPSATLSAGILAPADGGRLSIRVRRGAAVDSSVLARSHGELRVSTSPGLAGGVPLTSWLRAFADEVALHTAFDASRRVDTLLRDGGVPVVLARADASQGGHAAGVYLARLVAMRPLTDDERAEVLRVAANHVSSDAVMTDLLLALAARRPIGDRGPVRAAFDDAVATLQARAARAAVQRVD